MADKTASAEDRSNEAPPKKKSDNHAVLSQPKAPSPAPSEPAAPSPATLKTSDGSAGLSAAADMSAAPDLPETNTRPFRLQMDNTAVQKAKEAEIKLEELHRIADEAISLYESIKPIEDGSDIERVDPRYLLIDPTNRDTTWMSSDRVHSLIEALIVKFSMRKNLVGLMVDFCLHGDAKPSLRRMSRNRRAMNSCLQLIPSGHGVAPSSTRTISQWHAGRSWRGARQRQQCRSWASATRTVACQCPSLVWYNLRGTT